MIRRPLLSKRDHRLRVLRAGAAAAEDLLKQIYRIDISKALDPLDPDDFLTIRARLADKLKAITGPVEAAALDTALAELDVDWVELTAEGRAAAIQAASSAVLDIMPNVKPALTETFLSEGEKLAKRTRLAAMDRFNLDIGKKLSSLDQKVIDFVSRSQTLYVRDQYGAKADMMSETARDIVSKGLEDGLGRDEISGMLSQELGEAGLVRMSSYWNNIATIFANKARNFSNLSALQDADIEAFRFEAVMDEVTSKVCRHMHGRVFSVDTGLSKIIEGERAQNPEDVTRIQPFVSESTNDDGKTSLYFKKGDRTHNVHGMSNAQLEAAGVSVPPLHGNCRSTIVAEFG